MREEPKRLVSLRAPHLMRVRGWYERRVLLDPSANPWGWAAAHEVAVSADLLLGGDLLQRATEQVYCEAHVRRSRSRWCAPSRRCARRAFAGRSRAVDAALSRRARAGRWSAAGCTAASHSRTPASAATTARRRRTTSATAARRVAPPLTHLRSATASNRARRHPLCTRSAASSTCSSSVRCPTRSTTCPRPTRCGRTSPPTRARPVAGLLRRDPAPAPPPGGTPRVRLAHLRRAAVALRRRRRRRGRRRWRRRRPLSRRTCSAAAARAGSPMADASAGGLAAERRLLVEAHEALNEWYDGFLFEDAAERLAWMGEQA